MDEIHLWTIGVVITLVITLATGFVTLWWKVESKQDRALCALRKENDNSHGVLHEKIDDVRDKIESIWIHMVKDSTRKRR